MSVPSTAAFLFTTCQIGAEGAVKGELARLWPEFRFSYSRPGLLTFKLPVGHGLAEDFDLQSVFARAFGFSLGRATGADLQAKVAAVGKLVGDSTWDRLHVWPRDERTAGEHGYEPGLNEESVLALRALEDQFPWSAARRNTKVNQGDRVLDVVLVGPDEWLVGYHRVRNGPTRFPGGLRRLRLPADAVSRAYLKMEEGLRWSGLPVRPGQEFVELGCAPGGSCQSLLQRGLHVVGIDPAEVDERVSIQPEFTHVRKRASEVRRGEFRRTQWLAADMNVAPSYTLDTVESIVTHRGVAVRGLLLTLKLPEWSLAAQIPDYLARIRKWGYTKVRARQLQFNRQEICVAALRGR